AQSNVEGDTVTLALVAADSASNSLIYIASHLPADLGINPSTGVISGTIGPGASADSPYTVSVTANDSVNGSVGATMTLQWIVNAPTGTTVNLMRPGDQKNDDGDHVNLILFASECNGSGLVFTALNLPAGLSVSSSTGVIS